MRERGFEKVGASMKADHRTRCSRGQHLIIFRTSPARQVLHLVVACWNKRLLKMTTTTNATDATDAAVNPKANAAACVVCGSDRFTNFRRSLNGVSHSTLLLLLLLLSLLLRPLLLLVLLSLRQEIKAHKHHGDCVCMCKLHALFIVSVLINCRHTQNIRLVPAT